MFMIVQWRHLQSHLLSTELAFCESNNQCKLKCFNCINFCIDLKHEEFLIAVLIVFNPPKRGKCVVIFQLIINFFKRL